MGRLDRVDRGQIRRRSEFGEHLARGLELQRRGVLVAEHPARGPDQKPHPGDLVGRGELAPGLERLAQARERVRGVALGQGDRSPGVRRHRAEDVARLALRDLLELATGSARSLELAGGEHDLDVRGKQRRRA